ncbi:thiamine diphosphokinase [Lederbergia sp. NSJ-179]|uniref:thiamine diphosphokinase n=1 Tax=Lederbergia sp. NSJ-179 TaxID=2931402 RepID=UPI001FD4C671|nr:thiamine diphosphokinase [Lederbergia sp. NSJ-179]MCJ7839599.1 thiamine diphosphokinase [Lederbergia sp. NSJ-179]
MRIHIVAGGPPQLIPDLTLFDGNDVLWIGVDRGVYYVLKYNLAPTLAIGDFDSVTPEEWELIQRSTKELETYHPEKDETDMELALIWASQQNPTNIKIFGATGGRLDHFLANTFLLTKYQKPDSFSIEIIDLQNELSFFYPGQYQVKMNRDKKYISFIPLSLEVSGLSLTGFKYPLFNQNIDFASSLCISNELIQKTGTFSFEKGILMMVRSND